MEFDIKNNLLKTTVGNNQLGQKNIKASIDDSLVASTAQKNLDMNREGQKGLSDLKEKEKEKEKSKQKKEKEHKKQLDAKANSKDKNLTDNGEEKIVRDPLKLLKLL